MKIRWQFIFRNELFAFVLFFCVGCNSSSANIDLVSKSSSSDLIISVSTEEPTSFPEKSIFDPDNANSDVPPDVKGILDEVTYYGMGGGEGGGDPCQGIKNPTVISEWTDIKQMQYAWALMCGWSSDTDVTVTLSGPSNYFHQEELRNNEYGLLHWSHFLGIDAPLGEYVVEFSDGSKFQGFKFEVFPVTEPGVLFFFDKKNIQIFEFRPNEKVRVFLYSYDYNNQSLHLKAWAEFHTDSRGYLRIDLVDQSKDYVVVGEFSGEFLLSSASIESILKANSAQKTDTVFCNGAPKSRVFVGTVARITLTDGTPTRVREKPTTSAKILGRLAEGTQFKVVNGPKCADNYAWWQIQLANGTRGWIAEGSKTLYFIEPITEKQGACTGMNARLSVGKQARVSRVDGSNMRFREKPGFGENILGKVPEGTLLKILDGPRCVDGNYWWYVQTANGDKGWMTESQKGIYLLEPYP